MRPSSEPLSGGVTHSSGYVCNNNSQYLLVCTGLRSSGNIVQLLQRLQLRSTPFDLSLSVLLFTVPSFLVPVQFGSVQILFQ